ncbi:hypothetical protein C8Q73DRAFT_683871 [Cubamyces lactineus]|nr:hypothetical protein C8Q73DRAFT_683871 [Cubamyces lactineus]
MKPLGMCSIMFQLYQLRNLLSERRGRFRSGRVPGYSCLVGSQWIARSLKTRLWFTFFIRNPSSTRTRLSRPLLHAMNRRRGWMPSLFRRLLNGQQSMSLIPVSRTLSSVFSYVNTTNKPHGRIFIAGVSFMQNRHINRMIAEGRLDVNTITLSSVQAEASSMATPGISEIHSLYAEGGSDSVNKEPLGSGLQISNPDFTPSTPVQVSAHGGNPDGDVDTTHRFQESGPNSASFPNRRLPNTFSMISSGYAETLPPYEP